MSTYLVGDVQGCYAELESLLNFINFNSQQDRIGFVGDLVNRGPASLDVLRFVKNEPSAFTVLGNHEFFLLAEAHGCMRYKVSHTMHDILEASDRDEILLWLRQQPVLYAADFGVVVHAGIPPQWSIEEATIRARLVEKELQSENYCSFLKSLEIPGDETNNDLGEGETTKGLVYSVNALTRMRYCSSAGVLDLVNKAVNSHEFSKEMKPWFDWYTNRDDVFFGHWAALKGGHPQPQVYALDTGCVYGGALTAIRVEDKKIFQVPGWQQRSKVTK